MPSFSSPKTVTAAELAKLEQAFAANPGSEAWQPLAEAYLAMGRYMEAMVVCRKGARANASSPKPHMLLAEVYAAQGRDAKAKEEALVALQMAPGNVVALRLCGHLQMKLGEVEEGTARLLSAARADLTDMQTQAVLAEWGIPMPVPQPVTVTSVVASSPPRAAAPGLPPKEGVVAPSASAPSVSTPSVSAPSVSTAPAAAARASSVSRERLPEWIPPADLEPRKRSGSNTAMWSLVILFIGFAGVGAYYFWGQHVAEQQRQVNNHLRSASEQFKRDTYAAYEKAVEDARRALDLDSSSTAAHAYLAYAQAVRLTEHAGREDDLTEAKRHLAIAKQSAEVLSYTHMAEALLEAYHGRAFQAEKALVELVRKHESEGKRPALLLMTLGTLQMGLGDLDAASESLEKSQRFAPDEPRVYALSGKLARQKGNIPEAKRFYELALKYERNHPDSLIGRSWALLEQEEPGRSYITAAQDLNQLLSGKLEPSVRQEAMAHMLQALLVARVSADLPWFKPESFQRELEEKTGIGLDKAKNASLIAASENAARVDSQNSELRLIRAQRLAAENNVDGAIAEMRKAIAEAPLRAYFQIELARLWMRKNPAAREAEELLRKAQAMAPRNPVIPVLLAQVLLRQQKAEDAVLVLQAATAGAAVRNPEAKMLLASIFRDQKKEHPKAIALYTEAALEFGKDKTNVARAYFELGLAYEKAGNAQQSKESYEQALSVDYSFEKAYCRLAELLEASADAQDRERLPKLAEGYLSAWAQGECAAKMQQRVSKP